MNGNFHNITLSFGGNKLETSACFNEAMNLISSELGTIIKKSSLYKSEAWGMREDTHDFLNQVIIIQSNKIPQDALIVTQQIEKKLGRKIKSTNRFYEDRPIDIDILFHGDSIIEEKNLIVPHYLTHKRKFILTPLNEIIPEFIHPVLKKSMKELLLECEDQLKVTRIYN